jgi:hypothetical protein
VPHDKNGHARRPGAPVPFTNGDSEMRVFVRAGKDRVQTTVVGALTSVEADRRAQLKANAIDEAARRRAGWSRAKYESDLAFARSQQRR